MKKYACLYATLMATLVFTADAKSDDALISLSIDNGYSMPVHVEVDGKYSCEAKGHRADEIRAYTCVFSNDCYAYDVLHWLHEGKDGDCEEVDLASESHTVVITWGQNRISRKVNLGYVPENDVTGPATYYNECHVAINAGDTVPALTCDVD